jgi:hypothetical protein
MSDPYGDDPKACRVQNHNTVAFQLFHLFGDIPQACRS